MNRLVQDGQDLRTVTAEALGHFRNLLIAKTAPGQPDLLDVPGDAYEQLRIQAEKFTPGELARVIALLLAAQTDMRWTTSPRISLELALVRATIPDTDPSPAGVVARLERLERLADLDPTSVMPAARACAASPRGPPTTSCTSEPEQASDPVVVPEIAAEGAGALAPAEEPAGRRARRGRSCEPDTRTPPAPTTSTSPCSAAPGPP